MVRSSLTILCLVALSVSFAACGSGPGDLDPSDFSGNDRTIKEDPSFNTDILDIFQREGCANGACHGVGASAGLSLERDSAYVHLVGVTSTLEGFERVTAGKAAESYLVIKLEGRQQVGNRMPPSGFPLDLIDMGNIKNWINQGAKNN